MSSRPQRHDNPYEHDPMRAMRGAYAALSAGDVDGFVRPLAGVIVDPVLRELCGSIDREVVDLRVIATGFARSRGQIVVTGRCEATDRATGQPLTAAFEHRWDVMYGVVWRFEQRVDPPVSV